jgi:hypothetical protein
MKLVIAVLVAVVVLLAVAIGVAARDDDRPAGDPAGSGLALIEDLFPPRQLDGDDARAGGAACVQGSTVTLGRNGVCPFVVPDDVERIALRRLAGSGRVLVELVPPGGGLEQTVDTAKPGPDRDDPDAYRLAVIDDPSTVTVRCAGPQPCQLSLDG